MLKIIPSCVLSSTKSSTGTRPPHRLGGAHRRGAPYSSHRAPQRVRLGPSLAAALPNGLFEHPAGVFSRCATRAGHRIFIVQEVYFCILSEARNREPVCTQDGGVDGPLRYFLLRATLGSSRILRTYVCVEVRYDIEARASASRRE